jgi:nucleotide-binding universal stress UspA family protein
MYDTILLTVDLNDPASWERLFPTAAAFCDKFGSKLYVMTVVPDFGLPSVGQFFPENYADKALEQARIELDKLATAHLPASAEVEQLVAYGTPYSEILDAAKRIECSLIVMASHRPEFQDYLLGPNAARVVRHGKCSVMVVRD